MLVVASSICARTQPGNVHNNQDNEYVNLQYNMISNPAANFGSPVRVSEHSKFYEVFLKSNLLCHDPVCRCD